MVFLPLPEGTSPATHSYFMRHMFSMKAFGHNPGEIEEPEVSVVIGADGKMQLCAELTGLSPIMLGWKQMEAAPAPVLPETGDHANLALWLSLMGVSFAGAILLLLRRKKA